MTIRKNHLLLANTTITTYAFNNLRNHGPGRNSHRTGRLITLLVGSELWKKHLFRVLGLIAIGDISISNTCLFNYLDIFQKNEVLASIVGNHPITLYSILSQIAIMPSFLYLFITLVKAVALKYGKLSAFCLF